MFVEVDQGGEFDEKRAAAAQMIAQALPFLSNDQREVVRLHWIEGLTFPEISTRLGKSAGSLRVSAHRALVKMREQLDESAICNVLGGSAIQGAG